MHAVRAQPCCRHGALPPPPSRPCSPFQLPSPLLGGAGSPVLARPRGLRPCAPGLGPRCPGWSCRVLHRPGTAAVAAHPGTAVGSTLALPPGGWLGEHGRFGRCPCAVIQFSSRPGGNALHSLLPKPLSEGSLAAGGCREGAGTLPRKLENLGLRSPPNSFYIFPLGVITFWKITVKKMKPRRATRPPAMRDPCVPRWAFSHLGGSCWSVSTHPPNCAETSGPHLSLMPGPWSSLCLALVVPVTTLSVVWG